MSLTISYTPLELVYLFFIYAFIGWAIEVAYAAIKHGIYSNRGFLIGPLCPIYGFGVDIILIILTPIKSNLFLLFIGSVILTSTLEYLTGWFLEKKYNERWWDYSNDKFNLNGYICLEFSIIWGLACLLVIRIVNPPIIFMVRKLLNFKFGFIPALVLLVILIIDVIISDKRVRTFTKNIRTVELMDEAIRKVSDTISYDIYKNTIESIDKYEEFTEQEDVAKIIKELEESREDLTKRHAEFEAELQELTDEFYERREKRLSDRNELLDDIEKEIASKILEFEEERKKHREDVITEIKYRQKQREQFWNENEKSMKNYMSKFPGIEDRHNLKK